MNENAFTVSSVFKDAVAISKKSFFRIAGLSLLGFASYILSMFIQASAENIPKPVGAPIVLLMTIITLILRVVIQQATIRVALKNLSFGEALFSSLSDWKPLTLISILLMAIFYGGTLFLIIPGLIFIFWYGFASFVFADERLTGMDALMRSKSYIIGRWWKTLGYFILAGLTALGAIILAGLIFIINSIVGVFAIIAVWAFLAVFSTAFSTSFYKAVSASRAEVRSAPIAPLHWFEKTALVVGIVLIVIGIIGGGLFEDRKNQESLDFMKSLSEKTLGESF